MNVIFFKTNPRFINVLREKDNVDCCSFWYSSGLTSYQDIDSIVTVDTLYIEDTIFDDFTRDYKALTTKYKVETFEGAQSKNKSTGNICFFATNDTIVYSFKSLLLAKSEFELTLFCTSDKRENAKASAAKLNINATEVSYNLPGIDKYSLLLLGNDWGTIERKINWDFINKGKNTICIQESIIDFGGEYKRMQHCSLPVYQGIATLKSLELKNKICAVIGNPRYENLIYTKPPLENSVLINVNFTYNIFEEVRQQWVDDIVDSCSTLALNYLISQHPRDTGDLSSYNVKRTNAGSVHDLIRESTILVTRFSSLIHESLCLGRPVIYYNPHKETMLYDFEPDNKLLIYAYTKLELQNALKLLSERINENNAENPAAPYLLRHLGVTSKQQASTFLFLLIKNVINYPALKKPSFLKAIKIAGEFMRMRYWRFKDVLRGFIKRNNRK